MAWKFNPFLGALTYYEPGDEPAAHTHVETDITDLSHLELGETETTAYRGDYGATAYSHSQADHAPSTADNTAANETSHADVLVDDDVGISVAAFEHEHGDTYAASDHDHDLVYEAIDETILRQADVDDTPVDGVTTAPVSSNWAYDHAAAHAPSNADNTAANETSHADVLVDDDVGVSVAAQAHNHDASYSATGHNHDADYSAIDHDHDADYSAIGHDHDADYSPIGAATTSTKIDDFAAPDDNTDLNASTTAHGLCPKGDNNTSNFLRGDMTWAAPAGGGSSKEYASFYLGTGGVTAVAGTETTLTINQTSVNSDTDIFELASSQVTVNKTADFEVSFQVSFNSGGSARTSYGIWLDRDGVTEAGTYTETYQRGYDSGDTAAMSIILSITSGEVFQLRVLRADGAGTVGYQDDNGTRLTFKEM